MNVHKFLVLTRRLTSTGDSLGILFRSLFTDLVSIWDAFFGDLIAALLQTKTEIVDASNRTFRLSDIQQFSTMSEAREYIIRKEIEDLM